MEKIQHHLLYIKIGNSKTVDSQLACHCSISSYNSFNPYSSLFNLTGSPCINEMPLVHWIELLPSTTPCSHLPQLESHLSTRRKNSPCRWARRIRAATPCHRGEMTNARTASATQWPTCLMMAFVGFHMITIHRCVISVLSSLLVLETLKTNRFHFLLYWWLAAIISALFVA